MKAPKSARVALLTAVSLFFGATAGYAATQSVTANIRFLTDIQITKNSDINFGNVAATTVGDYTVSTAGVASAANGGILEGGTTAAGDLTIAGSANQTVNISVGSFVANNGASITATTCDYDGGGSGSCAIPGAAAPGAGKTLKIGATVHVNGSQADNTTAAPTFVVTVLYP